MNYNFIKTTDEETKSNLLRSGFKLVSQNGGMYVFLNDHSLVFDDKKNKIQYSNILTI